MFTFDCDSQHIRLCIVHWIAFVCLSVGFYFYLHLTQSLAIQKSHFISNQMKKMFWTFKIHLNRLFIMHCTNWAVNVCFGCCFVSATQNKYFLPAPIHTCGESVSFYLLWCVSLLSFAIANFIAFFCLEPVFKINMTRLKSFLKMVGKMFFSVWQLVVYRFGLRAFCTHMHKFIWSKKYERTIAWALHFQLNFILIE